jgi:iron-sulfur cluster insertion protein
MTNLATDSTQPTIPPPARTIVLTASAAKRIKTLNAQSGTNQMFRVTVNGGGCSGFQYEFKLDLIAGAEVDFIDDLMGAYFQVRNPNATSSCGCGTSFAIS